MTENRRIFWNVVATYGRSLYSLLLGLFTSRWALIALGEIDYGLSGVVGGLTCFISFFNDLIAGAVGRFYAVSVGKSHISGCYESGLKECRNWFSSAVFIHTAVPVLLLLIGYPIGLWAVKHYLTIPTDRIADCVWVFRFVCLTCFVSMVTIPMTAMYRAKQFIAELTIYSVVTTTLNAVFLYYMVTHPGVWLVKYSLWLSVLSVGPSVIICLRGFYLFPECRIVFGELLSFSRIKQLMYFVGSWFWGSMGVLLRNQGIQILVNKYFGPRVNASMSIANTVNAQTSTLSGAMIGAFQPAIVTAFGAGDYDRVRALAYKVCKFSMLFVMIFALPLSLELKMVLKLWLKNPPDYVYGLCLVMFIMTLVDQSAIGHQIAVNAFGKIAKYQFFLGGVLLMTLPVAWLFCALNLGVYSVAFALLLTMSISVLGRVWFARELTGMSARYWIRNTILPVSIVLCCSFVIGLLPRLFMRPSLMRIIVTTIFCEGAFIPLIWFSLLNQSERAFVAVRILSLPIVKIWRSRHA